MPSRSRAAIDTARGEMTHAVNSAMVEAYWTIGREIAETVGDRAEYGSHLITYLARNLITEYGKGFSEPNLRNMRQFYRAFPIRYILSSELSWSHYQRIMRVDSPAAREFYVREAATANWGVRELKRQIDTHLYERLLRTQEAEVLDGVADTERALTVLHDLGGIKDAETHTAMSPFKDPYVFEFADIPRNQHVLETDLESVLIEDCRLGFANLAGTAVRDVLIRATRIDELDLSGIDAQRVRFEDCRVGTLRLHGGSLSDVDLRGLEMTVVNGVGSLAGATVSSGQLSELAPLLAQHLGLRVKDQDHEQKPITGSGRA